MRDDLKILLSPLIGFSAKITSSSSKNLIGLSGKIIDETKNLLIFEVDSSEKKIPKKSNQFEIDYEGKKIKIDGSKIQYKPEEKAKNIKIKVFS